MFLNSRSLVKMGDIGVAFVDRNSKISALFNYDKIEDIDEDAADRLKKILDAKYEPADLKQLVNDCYELLPDQRQDLFDLLKQFEDLFDGTLGEFQMEPYNIELAVGAMPYHLKRPYTIPYVYVQTVKQEVERLVKLRVLKKINDSEWACGNFIITKTDGSV